MIRVARTITFRAAIIFRRRRTFRFRVPRQMRRHYHATTRTTLETKFRHYLRVFMRQGATNVRHFAATGQTARHAGAPNISTSPNALKGMFRGHTKNDISKVRAIATLSRCTKTRLADQNARTKRS